MDVVVERVYYLSSPLVLLFVGIDARGTSENVLLPRVKRGRKEGRKRD